NPVHQQPPGAQRPVEHYHLILSTHLRNGAPQPLCQAINFNSQSRSGKAADWSVLRRANLETVGPLDALNPAHVQGIGFLAQAAHWVSLPAATLDAAPFFPKKPRPPPVPPLFPL